jgi:anti-anti-sigma regulatory factor
MQQDVPPAAKKSAIAPMVWQVQAATGIWCCRAEVTRRRDEDDRPMATMPVRQLGSAGAMLFRSADVRVAPWHGGALAELAHLMDRPAASSWTDVAGETTITSAQRGSRYTAIAVGGAVDARTVRQLAAHLAGVLNTGTRHLVVDLSHAEQVDGRLLDLMRRVEERMLARDGVFELTGLSPAVLYAMDDGSLTEVFMIYRAAVDGGEPQAMSWASLRCPLGLGDVPEPHTSARHRSYIDMGDGG